MSDLDGKSDAQRVQSLIHGYRSTALTYAMVKVGLPDALASAPATTADLARTLCLHEASLERLLRGLEVLDLIERLPDGRCGLTNLGRRLVSSSSDAAHVVVTVESHLSAWAGLSHSLRAGEAAFDHVFGQSPWQHRAGNPTLDAAFNRWLSGIVGDVAETLVPTLGLPESGLLADVGGGDGSLLVAMLKSRPGCRGLVFDQPHLAAQVVANLAAGGVADRARFVGGDFFGSLGFSADVLLLKSILHDWDDARCVALLGRCRESLAAGGRLLIVERLLPARAVDAPDTVMLDLQMLAVTGGRERTKAQYVDLLARAGLRVVSVWQTESGYAVLSASVS